MARNVSGWGKFFMVIGVILFVLALIVGICAILDAYVPAVHTFFQNTYESIKPTTAVVSARTINSIPYALNIK